jgi:hypothetical protein
MYVDTGAYVCILHTCIHTDAHTQTLTQTEEENAELRAELHQLQQELAVAKKESQVPCMHVNAHVHVECSRACVPVCFACVYIMIRCNVSDILSEYVLFVFVRINQVVHVCVCVLSSYARLFRCISWHVHVHKVVCTSCIYAYMYIHQSLEVSNKVFEYIYLRICMQLVAPCRLRGFCP